MSLTKNEKVVATVKKEPAADRATAIRIAVVVFVIALAVGIALMNVLPGLGWRISAF